MELIHDLAEMNQELDPSRVLTELGEFNAKKKYFSKQFVWKAAEKTDPLTWWTGICSNTELSRIAEAILSCPPTSASVERSFSVLGNIHSAKRNKLTTQRAGRLAFISHNMKLHHDFISTRSQKTGNSSLPSTTVQTKSVERMSEDEELQYISSSDQENSDDFSVHDSSEYSDELMEDKND